MVSKRRVIFTKAVLFAVALTSGISWADNREQPRQAAKGCLRFPLQGVKVLSPSSMALVSAGGDVAIVRLSSPCLKGRAPQISLMPSRASDTLCKRNDIEEVIN